jgi:hypothetical protein
MSKIRFVGLDVHADTIAVAVAEPSGEVRSFGIIANRPESIRFSIRRALESFMRLALRAQSAFLVRGSSRRIMSMRFRPANIRVINRRADRLGRHSRCFPLAREKQRRAAPRNCCLTRSAISEREFRGQLNQARRRGADHMSKIGIIYFAVHRRSAVELRVIEHIEGLQPEFKRF